MHFTVAELRMMNHFVKFYTLSHYRYYEEIAALDGSLYESNIFYTLYFLKIDNSPKMVSDDFIETEDLLFVCVKKLQFTHKPDKRGSNEGGAVR